MIITRKEGINETFNLTYGDSRSLSDMAEIMKTHFPDLEINYVAKDNLTPNRGTLSIDKRSPSWLFPQSPLEEGYVKYINWYKQFFGKFSSKE